MAHLFEVTHFQARTPDNQAWLPIAFMTRESGAGAPRFFLGFETVRPVTAKDIERMPTVKALPSPHAIEEGQGLWLTPDGKIVLAREGDPLNDPHRAELAREDECPWIRPRSGT